MILQIHGFTVNHLVLHGEHLFMQVLSKVSFGSKQINITNYNKQRHLTHAHENRDEVKNSQSNRIINI